MTTTVTKPTPSSGIVLEHVSKHYGTTRVLDDISVRFAPGMIHGVLGRNGMGKTTLMSMICNHIFKSSGTIRIDGRDPAENAPVLERLCFIHEDQRWHEAYRICDIIGAAARFYTGWDDTFAQRLATRFRLPQTVRADKMSRGQRSSLAIVIALASQAPYTFLDEPYLGLDATARGIFYEELARTHAERPRTFLVSTHLIDECAELLQTVTVIDRGRVSLSMDADEATDNVYTMTGFNTDLRPVLAHIQLIDSRAMGDMRIVVVSGMLGADERERLQQAKVSVRKASLQELISAIGAHHGDRTTSNEGSEGSVSVQAEDKPSRERTPR